MALDFLSFGAQARVIFRTAFRPQALAPLLGFAFESLAAQAIEFTALRRNQKKCSGASNRQPRPATLQTSNHGR